MSHFTSLSKWSWTLGRLHTIGSTCFFLHFFAGLAWHISYLVWSWEIPNLHRGLKFCVFFTTLDTWTSCPWGYLQILGDLGRDVTRPYPKTISMGILQTITWLEFNGFIHDNTWHTYAQWGLTRQKWIGADVVGTKSLLLLGIWYFAQQIQTKASPQVLHEVFSGENSTIVQGKTNYRI